MSTKLTFFVMHQTHNLLLHQIRAKERPYLVSNTFAYEFCS